MEVVFRKDILNLLSEYYGRRVIKIDIHGEYIYVNFEKFLFFQKRKKEKISKYFSLIKKLNLSCCDAIGLKKEEIK